MDGLTGELGLRLSGIGGSLPTEMGQLTHLKKIVLGGEDMMGTIPSEMGHWTKMGKIVDTLILGDFWYTVAQ